MDFLFGIKGKNFVMVCSDTCASQQIITIKHDEDKLVPIDSHKLICISGARRKGLSLGSAPSAVLCGYECRSAGQNSGAGC